jgi:acyl-coenzyme A thioesterase PaaI-like protein
MDKIMTHESIDGKFSGKCIDLIPGKRSIVSLKTEDFMKADNKGLVHGGFTFSLADYAAMIAVNHQNVILVNADVGFTSPVKVGDVLIAKAHVYRKSGNKYFVEVSIQRNEKTVFVGKFKCLTLKTHVLDVRE